MGSNSGICSSTIPTPSTDRLHHSERSFWRGNVQSAATEIRAFLTTKNLDVDEENVWPQHSNYWLTFILFAGGLVTMVLGSYIEKPSGARREATITDAVEQSAQEARVPN